MLYDISPLINGKNALFEGEIAYRRIPQLDLKAGDNLTLSGFEMSAHMGAHVDAPCHYHEDGKSIDAVDLSIYKGDCQVIDVTSSINNRITISDLGPVKINAPRVLFKTDSLKDFHKWDPNFKALCPDLIKFLASEKVILVGIDTPSIDLANGKDMQAHKEVYRNQLAILEGIDLSKVKPGNYELCALPLNLLNSDASPVRAVLFDKEK